MDLGLLCRYEGVRFSTYTNSVGVVRLACVACAHEERMDEIFVSFHAFNHAGGRGRRYPIAV